MVLFLAFAVLIWVIGGRMDLPTSARSLMIAILFTGIVIVQILLPEGNPLRMALGGTPGEWASLGLLALGVWVYSAGLRRLRTRVRPENKPKPDNAVRGDPQAELERNARHIVLREVGGPGQKKLKDARVLVIGAGGLGSPALQYLAAAGVGTIGVIDDDVVENSNLQRQVIHTSDRIGMPKVFSAERAMQAQNPYVTIRPYNRRLTAEIVDDLFVDYDLVLDGTDDPETRYIVNAAAVKAGVPLVSAAISQWEGQISVFDPARGTPCYACVFPEAAAPGLAPSCAEGGVIGPLPGVVGAMMALEAIKLVAGAGETLLGRMLMYDALYADMRIIAVAPRGGCPVCGGGPAKLDDPAPRP